MVSTFFKKQAERRHLFPGLCYGPRALGGSKDGGHCKCHFLFTVLYNFFFFFFAKFNCFESNADLRESSGLIISQV